MQDGDQHHWPLGSKVITDAECFCFDYLLTLDKPMQIVVRWGCDSPLLETGAYLDVRERCSAWRRRRSKGECMKRILVPTDFSETSRIAVGHAVEVAEAVGAELLLLHVVDEAHVGSTQLAGIREVFTMTMDPTAHAFRATIAQGADFQALYKAAEWKLSALLPALESERLRTLIVVGNVADEIVRVATEERTHLIIMGIQGKRGWRRMHLDSVSDQVVQRSVVPVMTLWMPRSATADCGRAPHVIYTD
jgi:nucleotide-binding universal stress UspA family protein